MGGRYALEALVGRGGMGEVWRARHLALQTRVAIKFLQGAAEPSARARRRFLTEAQVTANLRTRHAVQVFDFGVSEDGRPYLVMELLEGETLDKRIARHGRLPLAVTSQILQKAARALERAHALGIVHRDFKPENVMLVPDEEDGGELVKVVDFGIAKLVGDLDATLKCALGQIAQARRSPSEPALDATSSGVGTPNYMAPEQIRGSAQVGPAADIWAFGVVAYECLTGRRPFEEDSIGKLLTRVLSAAPPAPASSIAPVPVLFDDWFRVACAANPSDRFPDVLAAASALAFALDAAGPERPAVEPASPVAPAEAAPTLSSRRECAEAAARIVAPPVAPPAAPPSLAARPDHVSPLAATLDPLPAPPPRPTLPAPISAAAAPRSLRMLPTTGAIAAAALGVLLAVHEDPRRPTAPVAVARAAVAGHQGARPAAPGGDRSPPEPVEIPSLRAAVDPAGTSSACAPDPPPVPSAAPRRPRSQRPSAQSTPSAYRLPPLGL